MARLSAAEPLGADELGVSMAKQKFDKFVELVLKSKLVHHDQLARALGDFKREAADSQRDDSEALAEKLVQSGLLTRWQCDRLQEGRYKAFFLGKYKLLGHLGAGGMSNVYLAEHTVMNRRVALKVLPKNRVDDSSYLGRFRREAQAAAVLDHRNIVRAYDIDNEDDIHYLVMEYIDGRDLAGIVKAEGPLDHAVAADYISQAAEGLQHAHEAGLVHRDVKPANLLVDSRGTVKVSDLGLARFSDSEKASLTVEHNENVLGTADYLAPEQALNSHLADNRADVYSLGCTLYFLLTGHPPFPEGTLPQRLMMHQTREPADLLIDRPNTPAELAAICRKMMSKSPAERYQSIGEVADALHGWLASVGRSGRSGDSGSHPRLPSSKRPPSASDSSPSKVRAIGDTVSNSDRATIKGGVQGAPSERRSDSSKGRAKSLPIAKPLEQNPYAQLESVVGSERPSSRGDSQIARKSDRGVRKEPPTRAERQAGESTARLKAQRASHEPPKWLWLVVAAGLVLTIVVVVLIVALAGH